MLLLVLIWVASIISNALVLYPGLQLLRSSSTSSDPSTPGATARWNRSVRFFRISCSAWNFLILLAFFLVEVTLKVNYGVLSPEVSPASTVAIAIFTSLLLAATIGSLAGLFFSLNLRENFDGFCAGGIVWLMFALLFAVLIVYEITLSYFGTNASMMIAKIYLVCTILAYLIYLFAAWFQTCGKRIRWKRAKGNRSETSGSSTSQITPEPPLRSAKEERQTLQRKLFLTGLILLTLAWLPFVYTCLARLYDMGTFDFTWQNHVYLGASISVVTSLAMPLAMLMHGLNRQVIRNVIRKVVFDKPPVPLRSDSARVENP